MMALEKNYIDTMFSAGFFANQMNAKFKTPRTYSASIQVFGGLDSDGLLVFRTFSVFSHRPARESCRQ